MAAVKIGMTPIAPHQDFRYTPIAIIAAPIITLIIRSALPTLGFIIFSFSVTFEEVLRSLSRNPFTSIKLTDGSGVQQYCRPVTHCYKFPKAS